MLSILGSIYGKIMDARNALYDRDVFEAFDLGAHTVSIGNITTGGTGKTPLVAYVAELLASRGEKVCILTRGYGRENGSDRVLVSDGKTVLADADKAGDEPFELARKLNGKAIVIADADRAAAAEWATRKFGVTAFVLDDAFQHRRARRDLDIVCIDATQSWASQSMLPDGRLREPAHNLTRADVIVLTRSDLTDNIEDLRSEITQLNPHATVFAAKSRLSKTTGLDQFFAGIDESTNSTGRDIDTAAENIIDRKNTPAMAFCGIGNPDSFFKQLRQDGFFVAATETFRDHRVYRQRDIMKVEKLARQAGAEILVMTAKDAVKLSRLEFTLPCFVIEIEVELDDASAFAKLI